MALGLRPLPKSDSLLTFVQAALARWSRLEKCCCVEWLSCSQKPSHLTEVEGVMISPSRATGVLHLGDLSAGVRQWMRSVLATEKLRLRPFARFDMTLNILWRMRTLVRYEGDDMVNPKSST